MNTARRKLIWPVIAGLASVLMKSHAGSESQSVAEQTLPIFSPYDFGALGNGTADDTEAVQRAADAAASHNGELQFSRGRFLISSYIRIKNGVRRITGAGGTILCVPRAGECGLVLAGVLAGEQENVSDCVVSGLVIDCSNSTLFATNAIWAQNPTRVTITDNTIVNLKRGYGILIRSHLRGQGSTKHCVVTRNKISAFASESAGHHQSDGIVCDAEEIPERGFSNYREQWKATHSLSQMPFPPMGCVISDNSVSGGYYGISINGAADFTVKGNDLRLNVRGISCQNSARHCRIEKNKISECLSAGIHIAYASSDITASDNTVVTTRGNLEALLQAYVGVRQIRFLRNHAECGGSNQYLAYTGMEANDVEFRDNTLRGTPARAYLAVESGWSSTSLDREHYGFLKGPTVDGFNHGGTRDIQIINNKIEGGSTRSPIYIGQIGDVPLARVSVKDNLMPAHSKVRVVSDTPALLRDLVMTNNVAKS